MATRPPDRPLPDDPRWTEVPLFDEDAMERLREMERREVERREKPSP